MDDVKEHLRRIGAGVALVLVIGAILAVMLLIAVWAGTGGEPIGYL